jgi:hypothetical protein
MGEHWTFSTAAAVATGASLEDVQNDFERTWSGDGLGGSDKDWGASRLSARRVRARVSGRPLAQTNQTSVTTGCQVQVDRFNSRGKSAKGSRSLVRSS